MVSFICVGKRSFLNIGNEGVLVHLSCYNKIPQMGYLTNIYFSQFWWLESPRSRLWQFGCLVRTCLLIHRLLSSCCNLTWQKKRGYTLGIFCKDTNPIHECSALMIESPLRSPTSKIPSHWVLGFNM